jgi:hypothetical protein
MRSGSENPVGVLLNCATRRRLYLRAEHVFGRSHMADTVLDQPDASLLHASIRWTGQAWELRDHSRNGVRVNDNPLSSEAATPLQTGALIAFCRDEGSAWIVEDLAGPQSVLWPMTEAAPVISLARRNSLPSVEAEEIAIYAADGGWYCAAGGQVRPLRDGDEVRQGSNLWCFMSDMAPPQTLERDGRWPIVASDLLLNFQVSLDEEHVSMQIVGREHAIGLGERAHHYCLLTLARKRLNDEALGLDQDAQGWVELERLAQMLGADPSHVNIQIFRARKQIALSLPSDGLPDIVERRRGAVRFGHWRARILRGSTIEGVLQPFTRDDAKPDPPDGGVYPNAWRRA